MSTSCVSGYSDSNGGPPGPKPGTLTNCATPRCRVFPFRREACCKCKDNSFSYQNGDYMEQNGKSREKNDTFAGLTGFWVRKSGKDAGQIQKQEGYCILRQESSKKGKIYR